MTGTGQAAGKNSPVIPELEHGVIKPSSQWVEKYAYLKVYILPDPGFIFKDGSLKFLVRATSPSDVALSKTDFYLWAVQTNSQTALILLIGVMACTNQQKSEYEAGENFSVELASGNNSVRIIDYLDYNEDKEIILCKQHLAF